MLFWIISVLSGVQDMRDHIDGFQTELDDMNYGKAKTLLDHVHKLVKHFSNITDGVASSEINATETYLNETQNSTNAREEALELEAKNRAQLEKQIEDLKANYTKMNNEDLLEFLKKTMSLKLELTKQERQNLIDGKIASDMAAADAAVKSYEDVAKEFETLKEKAGTCTDEAIALLDKALEGGELNKDSKTDVVEAMTMIDSCAQFWEDARLWKIR